MSKLLDISFTIFGKPWKLRVLTAKGYARKYGKDSVASTERYKHRIVLSPKGTDLSTITHEMVHAYITELCLSSTNISTEDFEEIFCELLAKHGYTLLDSAKELHKAINTQRKAG